MKKIPSKTLKHLKSLIGKASWIYAKTYADTNPHEYIVKGKCNLSSKEFEEIVEALEKYFIEEPFYKAMFKYTYIGDFKYWHMAHKYPNPITDAILVNRAEVKDKPKGKPKP